MAVVSIGVLVTIYLIILAYHQNKISRIFYVLLAFSDFVNQALVQNGYQLRPLLNAFLGNVFFSFLFITHLFLDKSSTLAILLLAASLNETSLHFNGHYVEC